jgi:uncharacterized protein (DUF2062 family)
MSIAAAAAFGVIPMFGVTTIAITCLALYLRFNLPLALFVTYAMGPIHLLLFIPFIRVGEFIM